MVTPILTSEDGEVCVPVEIAETPQAAVREANFGGYLLLDELTVEGDDGRWRIPLSSYRRLITEDVRKVQLVEPEDPDDVWREAEGGQEGVEFWRIYW